MNEAFHYYAIKALAVRAGIEERFAQRIAEYSQYIDDFRFSGTVKADWGLNSLIEEGLTKESGKDYVTRFVTTGFYKNIDYLKLMLPQKRNNILVPFHFILPAQMSKDNYDVPTRPAAPDHLVWNMFRSAIDQIRVGGFTDYNTMRLGMILHVFADTVAHQKFSGHLWVYNNASILSAARRNPDGSFTDELARYKKSAFPINMGHSKAGTTPDHTNIRFRLEISGEEYERDNFTEFMTLSEIIFNAFKECTGRILPNFHHVRAELSTAFLSDNDDQIRLRNDYTACFVNINFDYSAQRITNRLVPGLTNLINSMNSEEERMKPVELTAPVSREFYDFTLLAHQMRKAAIEEQYISY